MRDISASLEEALFDAVRLRPTAKSWLLLTSSPLPPVLVDHARAFSYKQIPVRF